MRDFKKFTFNELVKMIERMNESRKESIFYLFSEVADNLRRVSGYKVWQDGNHPELFFLPHFAKQKPDYLQHNPVCARLQRVLSLNLPSLSVVCQ